MAQQGLMAPGAGPADEMPDEEIPGGEGMPEEAGGEGQQASPEEQRQFDALLGVIYDTLHGKGAQQTLERMKAGAKDLANTVGEIAAQMLTMIEEKVVANQGQIANSVKLQVIIEIVEELLDIADAAGLVQGDAEMLAEDALTAAIGMYGAYAGATGQVDKDKIASDLQGMAQGGGPAGDVAQSAMQAVQQGGGGMGPGGPGGMV